MKVHKVKHTAYVSIRRLKTYILLVELLLWSARVENK